MDRIFKMLVIEDEKSLSSILKDKFELEGYDVMTAMNGSEGFEDALKTKPDVILLDLIMPQMDGITVLKKIRDHQDTQNIPVIILTNLNPTDEMLNVINTEQPAYYLIKSNTQIDDLADKVKTVLNRQKK
jgi:DNA-binding response OmpR family regulator